MKNYKLELVQIECTDLCNYECLHCYADAVTNPSTSLPINCLESLIPQLSSMGVRKVAISGGEPLLYPYLFELVRKLKTAGLEVSLDTNGSLLDREIALRLKRLRIDRVMVSLHGFYPETHDWLTQKQGSYYEAIRALDILAQAGVSRGISSTINRRNMLEIHRVMEIATVLGAEKLSLFRFIPIGRGIVSSKELNITSDQHMAVFVELNQLIKRLDINICISCEAPYVLWNKKERNFSPCNAGKNVCVIQANGDVLPCTGLRDESLICGNIYKNSLEDIWNNSSVLSKLRWFHEHPIQVKGICQECNNLMNCRAGCRAFAFATCGNIEDSDMSCWCQLK